MLQNIFDVSGIAYFGRMSQFYSIWLSWINRLLETDSFLFFVWIILTGRDQLEGTTGSLWHDTLSSLNAGGNVTVPYGAVNVRIT